MKTLDEVIKALEWCTDGDQSGCGVCPYCDDCDSGYSPQEDALFYLKEYRTTQMAYIKAMADHEDNPPLDWSELKQMEGKPVWICTNYGLCHWGIIDDVYDDEIYIDGEDYAQKDMVTEWQAYRKERS